MTDDGSIHGEGSISDDAEHPWPETAEALMRSRFAAFRDADAAWLLASWHHSTRPASLPLDDNPAWRGLQIVDRVAGGRDDTEGVVEFRATYREPGGGVGVQHERSRFVREEGRWTYLGPERPTTT
ncbi:YchJ family protein [Georgenia sp. Z1344]|uniref:YchJ family protein n=1 Tax=Georgenia sp. Z1344 TaxID=3416706 RepID=UPI003CF35180